MWHKCKNGTLVNLDQVQVIQIEADPRTETDPDLYHVYADSHTVLSGTREECETEMAEIEAALPMPMPPCPNARPDPFCRCCGQDHHEKE